MIQRNLSLSFPKMTDNERLNIERSFYRHMCDIFLEMIKSLTLSPKSMRKHFKANNPDVLKKFSDNKKSVIVICGHYASWEWMMSLANQIGCPIYGIYTPLSNIYFDRLVTRIRKRYNAFVINRYKTYETIKQHYLDKHVAMYGFASDQSPYPNEKTYWRTFMGVKVPVFTGAERIAKEFDIPIVYADIKRVKRGYYEVDFRVLTDSPKTTKVNEITDKFTEWLEEAIRRDPTQYLWSHNRFKYIDLAPN